MVMTDGDMNEIVQLEEAFQKLMPGCFNNNVDCISYLKDGRRIVIWVVGVKKHTRKHFFYLHVS